ncbi:MAG: cysteine-rich CWC family protein [Bacteroidales bacterium]|nr:cysteine-rich CWC family protein [Bacteroidales bacterium]MBK7172141.1 cysteine-rich CWC family protein [Bacteroidales bacterium]
MPNNRSEEEKKCPRCGKLFVCSASARCWCYEFDIPVDQLEIIERDYNSCVCPDCLKSFAERS